jgi:outer membrane protein TolC
MNRVVTVIVLLLIIQAGYSQRLSLSDAIDIALRNSMNIRIGKNNTDIAAINNSYGMAGGLPLVTATASDNEQVTNINQQYSDHTKDAVRTGVTSNILSGGVTGSVILYNGDRVRSAKKMLETTEAQTRQQLSSKALTVVYNVMLKYYDIVRQQSYAHTLGISIEASRQKLEIVRKQQSVGMANNADLFQAQVDLNTQIQNLQAQQLVIDQDKTDLLTLLTLKPDSTVQIADTILVDKNVQLATILDAIAANPDIVSAGQQVSINQYVEKEVTAQRYPALSLGAGYNINRTQYAAGFTLLNQYYGPYAGVTLNFPLFNGFIYRKQQQVADINVRNAGLVKDTLVLNYTANAVKNWQAYNSNLEQLTLAKENYDLSQKLLDLVIQRFQLHQATIVDVKNAQQSFENAGFLLINISFAAKSAEILLKRLANQLFL